MKLADQIIGKHAEVEPLSHRLREKTTVRVENQVVKGVNIGEEKKSKTDIKINLNSAERKDNKHALWEFVYKIAKPRTIKEVEKMLDVRKQMKIQMVVYYRIKKPAHEDDKLSDQEYRIDKKQGWKYKDVMDNTKADMVTSNNMSTVLAKQADKYKNTLIIVMTHGKWTHFIILLSHATPSSNLEPHHIFQHLSHIIMLNVGW